MKIRKSCRYYEWFGDYSLHTCKHSKRKHFFEEGCAGCPYYITPKQYRIKLIEAEIASLSKELAKLKGGRK